MAITYRLVKGTPLTNQEIDNNFSYLDGRIDGVDASVGDLSQDLTTHASETETHGAPTGERLMHTGDKTDGPTDLTDGALLTVGDFGVGEPISIDLSDMPNDLLGDIAIAGQYWVNTNDPADKPTGRFSHLVVTTNPGQGSIIQEIRDRSSLDEWFIRYSDNDGDTWSEWVQIYNSLNILSTETLGTPTGERLAHTGDLGTAAAQADTRYTHRTNNLSDLTNVGTARTNLGLGTAAAQADTRYTHRTNNLSDLSSPPTARNNLGGNAAGYRTVSTSTPSGGSNGDIWYEVA